MNVIKRNKYTIRLWLILLPFELASSLLAYWTLGWSPAFLWVVAVVFINLLCVAVYACGVRFAAVLATLLGIAIVGYHSMLGIRWYIVDREAKRIVEWAHVQRDRTGGFPEDLGEYRFTRPAYREFINYDAWSDTNGPSFRVTYHVVTESTFHWYDSDYVGGYYDD